MPEVISFWEASWESTDLWSQLIEWLFGKDQVEMWMHIVWLIWNNRNSCYHNLSCRCPSELGRIAKRMKSEYISAFVPQRSETQNTISMWLSPSRDSVKINVDVA